MYGGISKRGSLKDPGWTWYQKVRVKVRVGFRVKFRVVKIRIRVRRQLEERFL
jgi:hypothetical protein